MRRTSCFLIVRVVQLQAHLKSSLKRSGATRYSSTLEDRMAESLTIGELARRTGVTTSALRYYDELGLVRPPGAYPGIGVTGSTPSPKLASSGSFKKWASRSRRPSVSSPLASARRSRGANLPLASPRSCGAVSPATRQHDKPSSTPSPAPKTTSSTAPPSGQRCRGSSRASGWLTHTSAFTPPLTLATRGRRASSPRRSRGGDECLSPEADRTSIRRCRTGSVRCRSARCGRHPGIGGREAGGPRPVLPGLRRRTGTRRASTTCTSARAVRPRLTSAVELKASASLRHGAGTPEA